MRLSYILIPDKNNQGTDGLESVRVCVCLCKCFHGEDRTDFLWRRVRRHIHIPSRSDNRFSQRFVTLPLVWTLLNQSQNYFSGTWRRESDVSPAPQPPHLMRHEPFHHASRSSLVHCNQQSMCDYSTHCTAFKLKYFNNRRLENNNYWQNIWLFSFLINHSH